MCGSAPYRASADGVAHRELAVGRSPVTERVSELDRRIFELEYGYIRDRSHCEAP